MAFQSAANHSNLPNGNFSPTIFSQKAQVAFRKKAVCQAITNNDYFGEIANYGDKVEIIKEPEITVAPYARGTQIVPQDLVDENYTLLIDKSDYWAFKMDDIERAHAHHNWEQMATDRAGYRTADQMDQEVLGYMSGAKQSTIHSNADTVRVAGDKTGTDPATVDADGLLATMKLTRGDFSSNYGTAGTGAHSIPIGPNPTAGTSDFSSCLQILNRANRLFDQQNVPGDGRWIVVDPVFWEVLQDEDSKLVSHDYVSDGESTLRNGLKTSMPVRGMKVYVSNNMPKFGSGPGTATTTSQITNYGYALAGHNSAVAMAQQMTKSEKARLEGSFGDLLKGMNLYGRKILRPEALVQITYNLG